MVIPLLKSKIHRATVTNADLNYEGSISIDPEFMKAANLRPFEKVDIYNISNGERFSTYVIKGKEREICLNGAAAWKVRVGDRIIIASYCWFEAEEADSFQPTLVFMGEDNTIKSILKAESAKLE